MLQILELKYIIISSEQLTKHLSQGGKNWIILRTYFTKLIISLLLIYNCDCRTTGRINIIKAVILGDKWAAVVILHSS